MFGKQKSTTIERYIIPPAKLRYLALIFCAMDDTRALHDELTLLAHDREWNVQSFQIAIMGFGVVPVDLVGDLAYDQLKVDVTRYKAVKDVMYIHIR